MAKYKEYKKMLSLREQQIFEKYYKPLGILKENVAILILHTKRLGESLDDLIRAFEIKIQIQNQLNPLEELKWIHKNIDSMSKDDKKRFNDMINSSNDEVMISLFGNR